MGSRWAQKCISPFYPQTLLRFLRVLNIHGPTLHKASVDLMVCISPKHTQTSCKLFPAYLGPSRWACQVTEGYLVMPYLFPMIKVFIYTCTEQREIWGFVPLPSSKTPQLPAGSLHLATVFAEAPDTMCWSTARWMLGLWKRRNTHTTNQANKPRHPQERFSFKNREFLSSNPRRSYVLSFPTAGEDALRATGGAAIWVNLNLSVTLN